MRRLLWMAEAVFCLALVSAYLTRPGPAFPLPFQEIAVRLSADGQTVCFTAQRGARALGRLTAPRDTYPGVASFTDVFVGRQCLTTGANGASYQPALSPDGRTVAFCSEASNLAADDRNASADVFLWQGGRLRSLAGPLRSPAYDPAVTDAGLVAYSRVGKDITRELWLAQGDGPPRLADLGARQGPVYGAPSFSPDGTALAASVFAPRLEGGGTRLNASVTVMSLSRQPEGWIVLDRQSVSGDTPSFSPSLARHACAFTAVGKNGFYQVYVVANGVTTQVTESAEDSFEPSLSADGRVLAFASYSQGHRSQVYRHDRRTGVTRLVSQRPDGRPGDGPSYSPSLSGDGSHVAFVTQATDLEAAPVPAGQIYVWAPAGLRRVEVP